MPHQDYVARFCKVCDFYRENAPCRVVGSFDQENYASRNWCGWASIEGEKASVTKETVQVGIAGEIFDRKNEQEFREHFRSLKSEPVSK